MTEFTAEAADAGARLDIFVASKYPDFTRSSLEPLFDSGYVRVKGAPAKASYRVVDGDEVSVDESFVTAEPPVISLPVVYEDDDVIVIDKPAGILSHSKGALNLEATVASFIKPTITDIKTTNNRAGIVHRLDRQTSGLIITAKNARALSWLQKQFSQRKVKKTYLALVEGRPEPPQAVIDAPIGRNPKRPQTFKAMPDGRPSQTEYRVIKALEHNGHKYSLLELKPLTGRTHQLRVHLAYISHPIVGDPVYGHPGEHLMLHAAGLELTLPGGQRKSFETEPPGYFKEFAGL